MYVNNTLLKVTNIIKCLENIYNYHEDFYIENIKYISRKFEKYLKKKNNLAVRSSSANNRQKRSLLQIFDSDKNNYFNETFLETYCNVSPGVNNTNIDDKQFTKIKSALQAIRASYFLIKSSIVAANCSQVILKCLDKDRFYFGFEMAAIATRLANVFRKEYYKSDGVICKLFYFIKDLIIRSKTYLCMKPPQTKC